MVLSSMGQVSELGSMERSGRINTVAMTLCDEREIPLSFTQTRHSASFPSCLLDFIFIVNPFYQNRKYSLCKCYGFLSFLFKNYV